MNASLGEARKRPPRAPRTFDDDVDLPPFTPEASSEIVEPTEESATSDMPADGAGQAAPPAGDVAVRKPTATSSTDRVPARKPRPVAERTAPGGARTSDVNKSKARAKPKDEDGGEGRETATKGVPVHLPDDINDRLSAFMQKTGRSHQIVLMDAIETVFEQLGDLIKERLGLEERPRTQLFERDRQALKTSAFENRHKHTVRMTASNRRILDDLTEELGAPSRNFLIITAYNEYLPPID